MFTITTNKAIKINRGDDSPKFPLFLNMGTKYAPIRYEFAPDIDIQLSSKTIYNLQLDDIVWRKVIKEDGIYSFYFKGKDWHLVGNRVNLTAYGITYDGSPKDTDTITIRFLTQEDEVYFYILDKNSSFQDPLVKKIFKRNGDIETYYKYHIPGHIKSHDDHIINENGDMLLHLDAADTIDLSHGEYCYEIKAKTIDKESHQYILSTVTNKLPFFVIDNEFNRSW